MIDFTTVKGITIPNGEVENISIGNAILWQVEPSEPKNLIVGYTDGKYITTDGGVASLSSLTMVEAHGLIPGRKLHCTLWIDPNTYGNTAVGYTANGTYTASSNAFKWTALGNDVYECTIPANVEKLKFNIYTTQKETAVCYMPND